MSGVSGLPSSVEVQCPQCGEKLIVIDSEINLERGVTCTCGAQIPEEYLAGKLLFAHGLDEIKRKIDEIHERLKR